MKNPLWRRLLSFFVKGIRKCSANANSNGDNWIYFPYSTKSDQGSKFVNAGLFDSIKNAPQSLVVLSLTFKMPDQFGLPDRTEHEAAVGVEDKIESYAAQSTDWFVGRVTVSSQRHFYIYSHLVPAVWDQFVATLSMDSGFVITSSVRDDPEHEAYLKQLYPSEDDWQVIGDLKVISELAKDGDDGFDPRAIEHLVYFPDQASATPFVEWAQQDCYLVDPNRTGVSDDGHYAVKLTHSGTVKVADICSHTIALRRKAAEHGGEYDGWESEVLRKISLNAGE